MYRDIETVGSIAIFNGHIPEKVSKGEAGYINRSLDINRTYRIVKVGYFNDGVWYKVNNYNLVWSPIESFYTRLSIRNRYGLR
jgi:hypothetical protein